MIAFGRFFGLTLAACAIFALIDLHLLRKTISLNLALFVLLMNSSLFIMYGLDKRAAIKGFRRIPESSLHVFALLGGWPAAFIAQSVFHHKTRKSAFQLVHWLTVLASISLVYTLIKFPSFLIKI
jgi:uncharacterized membrane protein YsdA (DUF1294 family)